MLSVVTRSHYKSSCDLTRRIHEMRVLFFCTWSFSVVAVLISMVLIFTFRPLGRPLKRENVLSDSKTEGISFVHSAVSRYIGSVLTEEERTSLRTAIRICARWFTFLFGPFHASVRESSRYLISSSAWITAAVLQQAWWFIHSQCLTGNLNVDLRAFTLLHLHHRTGRTGFFFVRRQQDKHGRGL